MRWAASYRRSVYAAAGAAACIGRRSGEVDALLAALGARAGGFVSAWNPRSARMPPGWNVRAHDRLCEAARRLPGVEGWGGTARWQEQHVLIAADPRRCLVLARRFRQNAIVVVRRGARARLVWVRGVAWTS
jgi:hypothetical protein